ncbi:MAG: hypothetical protein NVSMB65_07940 [Chloroflexota bacterium]
MEELWTLDGSSRGKAMPLMNAHAIARSVGFYSPEALVEDGLNDTMARGHDAVRAVYGQLFSRSPDRHGEIPQRIYVGCYVLDEAVVAGADHPRAMVPWCIGWRRTRVSMPAR